MRDRTRKKSKTVDTTILHTEPLVVENFKLDLKRNVLFMERNESTKFFVPVYYNAPLDLIKEQPKDVRKEYESSEEYSLIGCEFFCNYKHLVFTLGKGKKDPAYKLIVEGLEIHIYVVPVYRYDRKRNEVFLEIEIQNREKDTFYINTSNIPSEVSRIDFVQQFFLDLYNVKENSQQLRHLLYIIHTQSKTNNYKGYTKVSSVPDTQATTRLKLAELATHITKYGTVKYGENGLGIFIGWLSYWNEHKATNNISDELLSRERQNFMDIFNRIVSFMRKNG